MGHSVRGRTQVRNGRIGKLMASILCWAEVFLEQLCQNLDQLVHVFVQGGAVRRKLLFDLHGNRVMKLNLRHPQKVALAVLSTDVENPEGAYVVTG